MIITIRSDSLVMPEISRRHLLRSTAAFGGAALLSNVWSHGSRAATESLTLYNGQHRSTTEALVAAFTKETGIAVTMRNAESPELASQLMEEGGSSPADLFYSEQSPPIASLAEKGLLAPVDADRRHEGARGSARLAARRQAIRQAV
jgi:iron(III) transport system substrate-binding protein